MILLMAALSACNRPRPQASKVPEKAPKESAPADPSTQRNEAPKEAVTAESFLRKTVAPSRAASATTDAPAQAASVPIQADSGTNSLLALDRGRLIPPEDFEIGPLALETKRTTGAAPASTGAPFAIGTAVIGADEKAALLTAGSFLFALSQGKASKGRIVSGTAVSLSESLTYYLERGDVPSSFRLGMPKRRDDGEIAVNVRLFKADGSAEGEIYLVRENRQWLVSDFQVDLSRLREKREKRGDFMPSSYRWLLGE